MGRKKVNLEKITNKHERQIAFSKRRTGLFSKASDLARAGCEVAVIVFSAVDNVFTFGHPSVEAVADRFLGQEDIMNLAGRAVVEAPVSESEGLAGPPKEGEAPPTEEDEAIVQDGDAEGCEGDEEKMEDGAAVEGESLAEEPLDSGRFWWNDRIDDLKLNELVELESSLVGLRDRVRDRANRILVEKPVMGFSFNFDDSKFKFRHED